MDIVEALNTLQPLVLREGDDCELDALSTIRAALAVVQNSSHNTARDEICQPCDGTGVRLKGDSLEYKMVCAFCNGTGKLSPVA